jgi:DNA-binding transcriptional LysR family regulator
LINITFQQIETFLAVAERLNLTETANALFISQPALSKIINRLEDAVGVKLFDRNNRGVSLTKAGAYLFSEIKRPYMKIDKTLQAVREMNAGPKKLLRIGYPSSFDFNHDFDVIRQAVSRFKARYSDVEIYEYLHEFVSLREALIYGDIDLIIGQSFVMNQLQNVSYRNVTDFHYHIALSSLHPLAKLSPFPLNKLENECFYEVFCCNTTQADQDRLRAALGFIPRTSYVPNFQPLIRTLSQGKGISICGRFDQVASEHPISYYPLSDYPAFSNIRIAAIWRTGDLTQPAEAFLDILPEQQL